jgi:transglutaminase-like putative cysteine protease
MNYRIVHRTLYDYTAPVSVSHHVARLEPRGTASQEIGPFSLGISPVPTLRKARSDYFGNQLCFFSIQENHQHLEIVTTSQVSVHPGKPAAVETSPPWEKVAQLFHDPVAPEMVEFYQFMFDSPQACASFEFADYAFASFPAGTPLLAGARDLTRRIYQDFKYVPQATTVATPLAEVWEKRCGVCQDFAHLAIACLRSLGLPARYVSGYLRTRPPEGGKRLVGVDASHAWFSIYCPGAGWVDFDPTNNLQPAGEHITVAYGRDFSDVSPVAGILTGGGDHTVKVAVDVTEI